MLAITTLHAIAQTYAATCIFLYSTCMCIAIHNCVITVSLAMTHRLKIGNIGVCCASVSQFVVLAYVGVYCNTRVACVSYVNKKWNLLDCAVRWYIWDCIFS